MKHTIILLLATGLTGCGAVTEMQHHINMAANTANPIQAISKFDTSLNAFRGHSADELIMKNGAPRSVKILSGGRREFEYAIKPTLENQLLPPPVAAVEPYTYANRNRNRIPVEDPFNSNIARRYNLRPGVENIGGSIANGIPNMPAPRLINGGSTRPPKYCLVSFEISASDIVESWSSDCN